jgi:outer membrane protein assembly factor BamB
MESNPNMTVTQTAGPTPRKPIRVWPGVVIVIVQWLAWFVVPSFRPETGTYGIMVGIYSGALILLWWLFFSRAPWLERFAVIVLMVDAIIATKRVVHESVAGGGMGFLLYMYAIPIFSLALVAAAAVGRRLSRGRRRTTIVGAILLACGAFMLVRTGGITGEGDSDLHWRWTETPEERLLAQARNEPATASAPAIAKTGPGWPGFRGHDRDGIVRGVRIETDWSKSAPVELWRRPIGPGWSSFAVQGSLIYTQEQRGDDEIVSCYSLTTGEPVWTHRDATRFWESNAGAGPRATPTISNSRVYAFGATGILNALDARDGSLAWSRNAASDTGKKVPEWGFASSPLVMDDLVVVAASGRLAAYDIATGQPRWFYPAEGKGGNSYSSPQLLTLHGVAQILLLTGGGVASVAPADGAMLWQRSWETGVGIVQPALAADGDILITGADPMGGMGMRCISIAHGKSDWTVTERWTSRGLKPYFNDFVVHEGHAFGFDNSILACIDLKDGARKWKGGRYGHGQLLLLADQDVLLVLSEEGELALIGATPEQFAELSRFPAIEGKTWNHPVLVGDILLVRNSEVMTAFRLSLAGR